MTPTRKDWLAPVAWLFAALGLVGSVVVFPDLPGLVEFLADSVVNFTQAMRGAR